MSPCEKSTKPLTIPGERGDSFLILSKGRRKTLIKSQFQAGVQEDHRGIELL